MGYAVVNAQFGFFQDGTSTVIGFMAGIKSDAQGNCQHEDYIIGAADDDAAIAKWEDVRDTAGSTESAFRTGISTYLPAGALTWWDGLHSSLRARFHEIAAFRLAGSYGP